MISALTGLLTTFVCYNTPKPVGVRRCLENIDMVMMNLFLASKVRRLYVHRDIAGELFDEGRVLLDIHLRVVIGHCGEQVWTGNIT